MVSLKRNIVNLSLDITDPDPDMVNSGQETSIVLASQARIVGPGEVEGDQYRGTHSYAGLLSAQC